MIESLNLIMYAFILLRCLAASSSSMSALATSRVGTGLLTCFKVAALDSSFDLSSERKSEK